MNGTWISVGSQPAAFAVSVAWMELIGVMAEVLGGSDGREQCPWRNK
jgi:hypothetical protein